MSARLAAATVWCALLAMALAVLALLARNILAIPLLVPLDPNEGWNAAHALAAMAGHALYPHSDSLMVNNYPPLSFYLVGELGRLTGDPIIAGRVLSLIAFLAACGGIALVLRHMTCRVPARLF